MRISVLLLTIVLAACQSESTSGSKSNVPDELKGLHQEILAVHDEVMPKMSELTNLQTQLSDHLKVLRKQDPVNNDKLRETNRVLGGLNRAESAMWDWMHEFSALDTIANEEKPEFLNLQKSSAESMRDLMLSSMETAKTFINENPASAPPQ